MRLEPLEPKHVEPLWEIAQDADTWRWMRFLGHESRATFDEWLATVDMGFAHYLDDTLIGHTSYLNHRPGDRSVEIGNTWVASRWWGSGGNTEAKYLLLKHAFEDEGLYRVEFKTEATNSRSRAALAALPAAFEGVHRKHMVVRGGERRDSAWYSVIDDEWPVVRAELEKRLA